jgi:hypothetical protein
MDDLFKEYQEVWSGDYQWAGVKLLPNGKYRMEECSDSSNENDYKDFSTLEEARAAAKAFAGIDSSKVTRDK